MMSFVARGGALAPNSVAVSQIVPSSLRPLIPAVLQTAETTLVAEPPNRLTSNSMASALPKSGRKVTSRLSGYTQARFAHTDIQVPDFSFYRRDSVKNSKSSSHISAGPRKAFTYLMVGGASVAAAYGSKQLVTQFVSTMSASADVLALAKIEVSLADIPEGKNVTFKWRGKPLFVRHRAPEEIENEKQVNVSELRDPQHDDDRVQKDKWLILIGVCTHLGCVPIANAGDYGGYYCPCHGSHYDCSGRIRKGPAPLNLEVPEYEFPDEDTIVVG